MLVKCFQAKQKKKKKKKKSKCDVMWLRSGLRELLYVLSEELHFRELLSYKRCQNKALIIFAPHDTTQKNKKRPRRSRTLKTPTLGETKQRRSPKERKKERKLCRKQQKQEKGEGGDGGLAANAGT